MAWRSKLWIALMLVLPGGFLAAPIVLLVIRGVRRRALHAPRISMATTRPSIISPVG
jgi:hypothetical protein